MDLVLQNANGHLIADVSGYYTMSGMRSVIENIAQCAKPGGLLRVLVDVSKMAGDASPADRYMYASYAAQLLRGRAKVAACAGDGQRVVELTANVAQAQGLALQVFRERSDALAWLLSD